MLRRGHFKNLHSSLTEDCKNVKRAHRPLFRRNATLHMKSIEKYSFSNIKSWDRKVYLKTNSGLYQLKNI